MRGFKNWIFIFLLLQIFSKLSYAANVFNFTKEADCREESVAVASKIKMQDQDGLLMCGAYSTAVLINAELLAKDPNADQTSALYLGTQFASKNNLNDLEITDPVKLARQSRNFDSCPMSVIGDNFGPQRNGQFLSTMFKGYEKKSADTILGCVLNAGMPNSNRKSIQEVAQLLGSTSFPILANNIFSDACNGQTKKLNWLPELKTLAASDFGINRVRAMDELKATINKNLKNQKITGINYCQLVLQNPSVNGINERGVYGPECKNGNEGAGHSSTIVARRKLRYKDGNEIKFICQYLVRDVYGASCAKYPDDPSLDPKERCNRGAVWVDEDALLSNTLEVFNF